MKKSEINKSIRCKNCNNVLHGKYCSECGEKQIDRNEYDLKKSLKRFFVSFTNIDSNIFISFTLLLKKPGFLTQEYLNGKRVLYLKPLQLFLLINLIYFLIQPFTIAQGFNNSLKSQINRQIYSSLTRKIIEQKLQTENASAQIEYHNRFNSKSETFAKSLLIIMAPFLALLLKLLYLKSEKYFVEHLIFSLHFYTFYILINFIFVSSLTAGLYYLFKNFHIEYLINDLSLEIILLLTSFTYLYFALKRVYRQSKVFTIIKCFLLVFSLYPIIFLYRFILFFITYIFV